MYVTLPTYESLFLEIAAVGAKRFFKVNKKLASLKWRTACLFYIKLATKIHETDINYI